MFSSTTVSSASMNVVYIIVTLIVIRTIHVSFFKPLQKVEDYISRSNAWLRCFRAYDKAIEVLQEGISSVLLSEEEKERLYFCQGVIYFAKRDYKSAVDRFDRMDGYFLRDRIPYDRNYRDMLLCYDNVGDRVKAKKLYQLLSKQVKYDERFQEIGELKQRFI